MKQFFLALATIFLILSCSDDSEQTIITPSNGDTISIADTTTDDDTLLVIDTINQADTIVNDTTTPVIEEPKKPIVYDDTTVIFDDRDEAITYPANSPVAINGQLQVIGNNLCNESGTQIQLRGMSSMGLQWTREYMNPTLFDTLAYDWGADIVRIAVYVGEGGYMHGRYSLTTTPKDSVTRAASREEIDQLVYEIGQRGMYCLIDWHTLSPGDPWIQHEAGLEFWKYMAKKHANKTHVLFEVFNEPNNNNNPDGHNAVVWSSETIDNDLKTLAEVYIPIIRKYDTSKSIVIVGNENWSAKPEKVIDNMLDYENIMYTYHYYSDLHGELSDSKKADLLSVPIFVTEWGWGETELNLAHAKSFIDWMSVHKISWIRWALQDGDHHGTFIDDLPLGPYYNNLNISGIMSRWNIKYPADNFTGGENGPFIISKEIVGEGSIKITPEQDTYNFGDKVTIEAIPAVGMELASWYHDTISTNTKLEFTVDNSSIFKAVFREEGNYLLNGSFRTGTTAWEFDVRSGTTEMYAKDGECILSTTKNIPVVTTSIFYQDNLTIPKGSYTVSFDCYSNMQEDGEPIEERLISVEFMSKIGIVQPIYLFEENIAVTATKKTYSYDFEVTKDPRIDARDILSFGFGNANDDITFDNISIRAK